MSRPRPGRFGDMTSNEKRVHTLDWRGPLKGLTIVTNATSPQFMSKPTGLTFTDITVSTPVVTFTITAPAGSAERNFEIFGRIQASDGQLLETAPPIEMKVIPGGTF